MGEGFQLLDQVRLLESIPLTAGIGNALEELNCAPVGTLGSIVEVLEPGQVYLVELFGDWVKLDPQQGLRRALADESGAFLETLGVEVVQAEQLEVMQSVNPVKVELFRLLDEMPEALLEEVQTFAEFLRYRREQLGESVENKLTSGSAIPSASTSRGNC